VSVTTAKYEIWQGVPVNFICLKRIEFDENNISLFTLPGMQALFSHFKGCFAGALTYSALSLAVPTGFSAVQQDGVIYECTLLL